MLLHGNGDQLQMWPPPYFTPALLNLNVPTMYVQEDEEWKWDGWWGWSSMWAFCPFYPLAPGKWGEMIPLFHPFSCPITRRKKNIRNRAEGRRGHLHHFQDWKKPNCQLCNRGLGFKWIYNDTNTSPNLLLLNIPTVYRPILQFSPNCMDLKLVKSEDCAQ